MYLRRQLSDFICLILYLLILALSGALHSLCALIISLYSVNPIDLETPYFRSTWRNTFQNVNLTPCSYGIVAVDTEISFFRELTIGQAVKATGYKLSCLGISSSIRIQHVSCVERAGQII